MIHTRFLVVSLTFVAVYKSVVAASFCISRWRTTTALVLTKLTLSIIRVVTWSGLSCSLLRAVRKFLNLHRDMTTTRVSFSVIRKRAWNFVLPIWHLWLSLTIAL